MPSPAFPTFITLAVLLIITPGADTVLLARNALTGGRGAAVATVLGSRLGLVAHALLAAMGLSAVLATSADAFQVVKMAGAMYLVWLGLRTLWRAARPGAGQDPRDRRGSIGDPWLQGFLTNLLNPKTALFYLAVLPQFIEPGHNPAARSLFLAGIHIGLSLVWYLSLAFAVGSLPKGLKRGPLGRAVDAVSGTVFVALGLRLAVQRS